jgi:hypothetical protein
MRVKLIFILGVVPASGAPNSRSGWFGINPTALERGFGGGSGRLHWFSRGRRCIGWIDAAAKVLLGAGDEKTTGGVVGGERTGAHTVVRSPSKLV